MMGLTPKQAQCLDAIKRLTENGVPPTYETLKDAMGIASKGGIHRMVCGLEERGYITRIPNKHNSIKVINPQASSHGGELPASYANWSTAMLRTAYREIEAELVRRAVS